MLTVAQLFDSSHNASFSASFVDVRRSAIRILLTCVSKDDKDVRRREREKEREKERGEGREERRE